MRERTVLRSRPVSSCSFLVTSVARDASLGGNLPHEDGFRVSLVTGDGKKDVHCRAVVIATGLARANQPDEVHGLQWTEGYENLPEDGSSFAPTGVKKGGAERRRAAPRQASKAGDRKRLPAR